MKTVLYLYQVANILATCAIIHRHGCRQLFRTGVEANKVKTKELQFGSKERVWEGDMPPSTTKCSSKSFLQNLKGVREQIRVIFTKQIF